MKLGINVKVKRVFLFCFFLIFILNPVFGLYSSTEYVYSGDSVEFKGYNIQLIHSSNSDKVMFKIDDSVKFLNYGLDDNSYATYLRGDSNYVINSPPSFVYEDIKVTIEELCFDLNKKKCGRLNEITKFLEPSFKLKLSLFEPSIKVNTIYEKDVVMLGEYITVTTEIENSGDVDVNKFELFENYPSSVNIKINDGVYLHSEGIRIPINVIKSGKKVIFRYKIALTEDLEYSLKSLYSYSYNNKVYQSSSSNKKLSLQEPYSLKITFPKNIGLNEDFEVLINIANLLDKKILNFNLNLDLPKNFTYKKGDFKLENGQLILKDSIKDSKQYSLIFSSNAQKKSVFNFIFTSVSDYENPVKILTYSIDVINKTVEYTDFFDFSLNLNKNNYLIGNILKLEAHIVKGNYVLKDVFLNLTYFNKTIIKEVKEISSDELFYNVNFDIPLDLYNFTTDYNLVLNISGLIVNNKNKNKNILSTSLINSKKVKVYALPDAFEIKRSIVPSKINQGDEGLIKVSIKNKIDQGFSFMSANEIVPEEFRVSNVGSSFIFNIQPLEEKLLYSYKVRAPYLVLENKSVVMTNLSCEDVNWIERGDFSTYVSIKKPVLDLQINLMSDLIVGGITKVGILIKNIGDISAYNLHLDFPLSQHMDLIVKNSKFVEILDSGESVEFFLDYIPKKSGELSLQNLNVLYSDKYGNSFEEFVSSKVFTVNEGSLDCFLIAQKELAIEINKTFYGNKVPFLIKLSNNCDSDLDVFIQNPELRFSIGKNSEKIVQFLESHNNNFTYSKGSIYFYSKQNDSYQRKSITNSIKGYFEIINLNKSSLSSLNSLSNQSVGKDDGFLTYELGNSNTKVELNVNSSDEFGLSFFKRFIILVFVVAIIFIVMFVFLKIIKKASSKKNEVEEKIALPDTEENFIVVPEIKAGLDELDSFIQISRENKIPNIEIEQSLIDKGWTKDVIDGFMKND